MRYGLALLLLGLGGIAIAQDRPTGDFRVAERRGPVFAPPASGQAPSFDPYGPAGASPSIMPAAPVTDVPAEVRFHHLLQAAAHLQAAGHKEDAERVRREAEQEKQALLARLAKSEAEAAWITGPAGPAKVVVHIRMMEVSRTKLQRLGLDFAKLRGVDVIQAGPCWLDALESHERGNLGKVLAEPTLTCVSGQPAMFQIGGQFPITIPGNAENVSIDYRPYGTQIDVLPQVLGNGRIRLELRLKVSELDATHSVVVGSTSVPGVTTREMETGVEMAAGQALVISGLGHDRGPSTSALCNPAIWLKALAGTPPAVTTPGPKSTTPGSKQRPFSGQAPAKQAAPAAADEQDEIETMVLVRAEILGPARPATPGSVSPRGPFPPPYQVAPTYGSYGAPSGVRPAAPGRDVPWAAPMNAPAAPLPPHP